MDNQKNKLRCRNKGIVVTSNPEKYNVVWKRKFNPDIFSIDKMLYRQDCNCIESEPFINSDNNFKPYCRWCGTDFKKQN